MKFFYICVNMDLEEHTGNSAKKEEKETTELTIITENVEANKGISKQDY